MVFKDWFEFRDVMFWAVLASMERGQFNKQYFEDELEKIWKAREAETK